MSVDGPDGARGEGLAPQLPAACRAFLAAASDRAAPPRTPDDHVAGCAHCSARLEFQRRAAAMLSRKPALPGALTSRAMLESVYERIVGDIEAVSRVGPVLADREAVSPPRGDWRDDLLESTVARAMLTPPAVPSDAAWRDVQNSLLSRIVRARAAHPRWRIVVLASAAAAVTAAAWLVIPKGTPETVSIVFADLETAPAVEYAFVRRGPLR